MPPRRVIISRTDSIGDVVLTLPIAGVLKSRYPNCEIFFLGNSYTEPVIRACQFVDKFLDWDKIRAENKNKQVEIFRSLNSDAIVHVFPRKEIAFLAKKAKIRNRVGATGRWYHLLSCNRPVYLTRSRSDLHEAQLNLKLLSPLGVKNTFSLKEIPNYFGLTKITSIKPEPNDLPDKERVNLILHPKSKGSAVEWGLENFSKLIHILPEEKYKIYISGTEEEGDLLRGKLLFEKSNVIDLTGKLNLSELIGFTASVDGLVASSTGPLHLAAALGKFAIGLYSPRRPIHPGRWMPVGSKARAVVFDENCPKCKREIECDCIKNISPEKIKEMIETLR